MRPGAEHLENFKFSDSLNIVINITSFRFMDLIMFRDCFDCDKKIF